MTVTNLFDLGAPKLGTEVNHRVRIYLGGLVQPRHIQLIVKRSVETLGHCQILRCVLEDILLLEKKFIYCFSVYLAG